MNRKICAALAIVVACGGNLSSRAGTIAPGIGGTVYFDQDKNGSPSGSESIPGVSLNLYRDDNNNGVFDSGTDSLVGNMLSNASGFYCFEGLNFSSNYFVQRPAQTVGSFNLPAEVSAPLKPFTPSVLIDDFVNNQVTKANPNTPTATSTLFDPTSNILGGERDLYTRLSSGVGDVELRSNAYGVHVLQFDNSSGVIGQGIVTWDGKDMSANPIPSLGLGNVDLTKGGQATGFLLQLGIDAAGANEKVRLRLFKDSNSEFSEISVTFPVTGGTASEWAYAPFTDLIGSVLPNNVNAIQMLLGQGAKSVDAQVGNISSVGPTKQDFAVVPEPTSLLMLLAGSLGLLAGRRR